MPPSVDPRTGQSLTSDEAQVKLGLRHQPLPVRSGQPCRSEGVDGLDSTVDNVVGPPLPIPVPELMLPARVGEPSR